MFSLKDITSPTSLFSACASFSVSLFLFQTMFNQFLPYKAQQFILSTIHYYFKPPSSVATLVIEETNGMTKNELYNASEIYLTSKINLPDSECRLKVSKSPKENNLTIKFEECEKIVDSFDGFELKWRFKCLESKRKWFELCLQREHRDRVLSSYLPFVIYRAEAIENEKRVVKLHSLAQCSSSYGLAKWDSIKLENPTSFDKLAMDWKLKKAVMEDLDRFVKRKEFYKRVGKGWKRGYLLYGPPGTGKSSLVAAMAKYLQFDVYELQLGDLNCDLEFRKVLLGTSNKSILVIEDIDCSVECASRPMKYVDGRDVQLKLSGLLNLIDGLWSSCGDERIIIFSTNHKDGLDTALLQPGHMDMHIHMSYCTIQGFKLLASNYLGIHDHHSHKIFHEIEGLIEQVEVTPAEVAEELTRSADDADVALGGVVNFLKRKKMAAIDVMEEKSSGVGEVKRLKVAETRRRKSVRNVGRR